MSTRLKLVVVVAVVAVMAAAGGVWWWLSDDPPDELSVDDAIGEGAGSGSEGGTGAEAGDLDGTWSVAEGADSQAGLRVTESFVGGAVDHEAVGRSTAVSGDVAVAGADVTEGAFTVDLTRIEWSDSPGFPTDRRSDAIRDQGLETGTYPEGTFELTEPVSVGSLPAAGQSVTVDVTGDLTLHGVSQEVTFPVDVALDGDRLLVGTAEPVPVALADYEIEKPQSPSVASISDEGSFEFLVTLERA